VRVIRTLADAGRLSDGDVLVTHMTSPDWMMAEVPSVLFNLERYAALGIAGISIGSNDLTQLMLGADAASKPSQSTWMWSIARDGSSLRRSGG
jgi:pyruvate,water dikinase